MFKKNSNYFELIPMSNQTLTRFQEAGMAGFKKFAILKKTKEAKNVEKIKFAKLNDAKKRFVTMSALLWIGTPLVA